MLTRFMGIQDANNAGNVHGGVVMRLCDEAAAAASMRHCGTRVVTAGMDRMSFLGRVLVGDLVTVRASVNAAWRTSMEVGVRVEREDVRTGEVEHTTTAYLTMVALDEAGRPVEVPPLEPQTDEERRRCHEADLRRRLRLEERAQLEASRRESLG